MIFQNNSNIDNTSSKHIEVNQPKSFRIFIKLGLEFFVAGVFGNIVSSYVFGRNFAVDLLILFDVAAKNLIFFIKMIARSAEVNLSDIQVKY